MMLEMNRIRCEDKIKALAISLLRTRTNAHRRRRRFSSIDRRLTVIVQRHRIIRREVFLYHRKDLTGADGRRFG